MTRKALSSSVYLTSMTKRNHQNQQCIVLDIANYSYIPNPIAPIRDLILGPTKFLPAVRGSASIALRSSM